MASFDIINYSLRPSKSIQRRLVFEGVRTLKGNLELDNMVYIGFGSVWFTDFVMAHKLLGIQDMVSMEADVIGYKRALFNAPYATVRVMEGSSAAALPCLYGNASIGDRPWVIWLDYDRNFDEGMSEDIRSVIVRAPSNSTVLVTLDGGESDYGCPDERPDRMRELFGGVVPDDLKTNKCTGHCMQETLADLAIEFMKSAAGNVARPGGFVPAFRLIYKDKASMVTVGGVLPAPGKVEMARRVVRGRGWRCRPKDRIVAPHLTIREALALQSRLPKRRKLTRAQVRRLGFDLNEEHIAIFERYYREYPMYAEITT